MLVFEEQRARPLRLPIEERKQAEHSAADPLEPERLPRGGERDGRSEALKAATERRRTAIPDAFVVAAVGMLGYPVEGGLRLSKTGVTEAPPA